MAGPKRTVSSIQLPSKGIWKNEDDEHKQGNFRKVKSLEVLSTRAQSSYPCEQGIVQMVMESLLKEKLEFSAFLDEITRQIISPSSLSCFGNNTRAITVASKVSRGGREQHAKASKQEQKVSKVLPKWQSSAPIESQCGKTATEGKHKGSYQSGHGQSELHTERKGSALPGRTSGLACGSHSNKLSSGTSSERSHKYKHPGHKRCYKHSDRDRENHMDRAEPQDSHINCRQTNCVLKEKLQSVMDKVTSERKYHLYRVLELTKQLDAIKNTILSLENISLNTHDSFHGQTTIYCPYGLEEIGLSRSAGEQNEE